MIRAKITATAIAALAVIGVGSGYAANASIFNAPQYTVAGANSVAGWYGTANNGYFPTHIKAYLGSAGNSSLENLPISSLSQINGGLGIAFCDSNSGEAVQVGDVYIGNGLMDVVAGSGQFGAAVNNGDRCQNGVVNPTGTNGTGVIGVSTVINTVTYPVNDVVGTPLQLTVASGILPTVGTRINVTSPIPTSSGSTTGHFYVQSVTGNTITLTHGPGPVTPFNTVVNESSTVTATGTSTFNWTQTSFAAGQEFHVLLTNVPVNDTVQVDEKLNNGYSTGPAGGVQVQVKDLSVNKPGATANFHLPFDTVFDEVDAGVVADTQQSVSLTGSVVPAVNNRSTESNAPSELARIAHFDISANVLGHHEFHGASATAGQPLATSAAFVGSPVAASINGQPNNGSNIKLNVSNWYADNFYIQQGALVS